MNSLRSRMPLLTRWRRLVFVSSILVLGFWLLVLGPVSCSDTPTPTEVAGLPAIAANLEGVTVSGLSSGAYMAGQFQLAHAGMVGGAAIIAGGPFACAESAFSNFMPEAGLKFLSASRAVSGCMLDTLALYGIPNAEKLAERARELAEAGGIGPLDDAVTGDRLYLYSGTNDQVVKSRIVRKALEFYRLLGVPDENIRAVFDKPSGHAILTMDKGGSCDANAVPYIVDCDYDQVGAFLQHLYPGAKQPEEGGEPAGQYVEFNQTEYLEGLEAPGLTDTAVVYVPPACRSGGCRVHVAFHGCQQNRSEVKMRFIRDTGYARWADANDLIVLYPEVAKTPLNPLGCWDWWGYTGKDYLTRSAPQIEAVRRMLDRLSAEGTGA